MHCLRCNSIWGTIVSLHDMLRDAWAAMGRSWGIASPLLTRKRWASAGHLMQRPQHCRVLQSSDSDNHRLPLWPQHIGLSCTSNVHSAPRLPTLSPVVAAYGHGAQAASPGGLAVGLTCAASANAAATVATAPAAASAAVPRVSATLAPAVPAASTLLVVTHLAPKAGRVAPAAASSASCTRTSGVSGTVAGHERLRFRPSVTRDVQAG